MSFTEYNAILNAKECAVSFRVEGTRSCRKPQRLGNGSREEGLGIISLKVYRVKHHSHSTKSRIAIVLIGCMKFDLWIL